MGKRALQLGLIACLGALLAWWLAPDDDMEASAAPSAAAPRPSVHVEVSPPTPAETRDAPLDYKLPKMAAALPEPEPEPGKELPAIYVPKSWQLRGSASKNYELRSDRTIAFSGNYSAVLSSHDKDIQPNLTGSAVQAVLASPYVGTRVELTASLRVEGPRGAAGSLWIYVTDPARVVIAYQIAQMSLAQPQKEWQRYRIVMDVPWHGEVIAYGFSLEGKGKLWADDVKLTPVDVNVPATGKQNSHQLGVIAQAVSLDGALANPTNLDFEDVLATRERQPEAPPDEIRGTRF
jgi:hypothetical protein